MWNRHHCIPFRVYRHAWNTRLWLQDHLEKLQREIHLLHCFSGLWKWVKSRPILLNNPKCTFPLDTNGEIFQKS
jgi:hypothetical protein